MRKPLLFLVPVMLTGCTVGPNYAGPPTTASHAVARGSFVRAGVQTTADTPALSTWWEGFNDPLLNALVADALAHSPTIDQVTARVREAQAQARQQKTSRLPSVSANGTVIRADLPPIGGQGEGTDLTFYNLGLNAAWELDLFGGGRRANEQANANVGARIADLADAQVSLTAGVAQAYVALRDVQERIRLNAHSTDLQKRQIALTRQRFDLGTASKLDLERLQGQLEQTQAQAIPLAAQRDEYLNQLAVLTGRTPGALDATLSTAMPVPLPPAQVAVGDPAQLIARRPDVRAAERQLAAATAGVGVNKAKELPTVRFLGLLGLGGTTPGAMFDLGNLTTLAAPSLSWSFLDFGRAKAATRASEAQRDAADATYRRTVLEALEDAETQLSRFANTRLQLGQLAQAEATSARAATLNRQRVAAGTSRLIDQLDIERQQIAARVAVAQAKAGLSTSYIGVNKALGLGWSAPDTAAISAGAGPKTAGPTPR
ncbi:efflux transporter outer membrane subunit [uncultured Sphingomonas sp.]|uniref:efflux transporter outer membrane subunit n=1 Tax=uncultured Sphingomonas sp. TaxID=158754 RepID=UPI0025F2DB5B|nr:efflux transporter outer membrane subunit [uncultured Sphingomonas sp.]